VTNPLAAVDWKRDASSGFRRELQPTYQRTLLMPRFIVMPKLNDTGDPGEIRSLHLRPGDSIALGAPVGEVEMDKAILEIEATEAGRVKRILVNVGDRVPVGQPLIEVE
jgi:pyruvate/2-oxoglutarate dehydrogenase complex dihydrolipoamide acyltransferase (E2) component